MPQKIIIIIIIKLLPKFHHLERDQISPFQVFACVRTSDQSITKGPQAQRGSNWDTQMTPK